MVVCPGCGSGYWPRQIWQHRGCVANDPGEKLTNSDVANSEAKTADVVVEGAGIPADVSMSADGASSRGGKSVAAIRVQLWREANRERYNARQRELMRERRKKAKLGPDHL